MNTSPNCHQHKTHKMDHFLEICLLIILSKQSGYGYDLMSYLPKYGFLQNELNIGSLYRVLRKMEDRGLITSKWETSNRGPDKRIYEINDIGKKNLSNWIHILKERQKKLSFVIDEYHSIVSN